MPTFIALLRGVNVSGKNLIHMANLRERLTVAGLNDVQTYLQSGNIVFHSAEPDTRKLARRIEACITKDFGHDVRTLVIASAEFRRLVRSNPLIPANDVDEQTFHVTFLFELVTAKTFMSIPLPAQKGERAVFRKSVILLHCPNGYGRTKLNNTFFEKSLGVSATTRNWRTVKALEEMTE